MSDGREPIVSYTIIFFPMADENVTRLNHELIDKLVILRMNLKFMIYCRGKHASIGKVNEVQNDMGNDEDIYVDEYD